MNDPASIARARNCLSKQCDKCHGTGCLSRQGPKLKPKKLAAEDVYLRMTYGWRTCRHGRTCSPRTSAWRSRPTSRAGTSRRRVERSAWWSASVGSDHRLYEKPALLELAAGTFSGVSSMTRRSQLSGRRDASVDHFGGRSALPRDRACRRPERRRSDRGRALHRRRCRERGASFTSATAAAATARTAAAAPRPSCRTSRISPQKDYIEFIPDGFLFTVIAEGGVAVGKSGYHAGMARNAVRAGHQGRHRAHPHSPNVLTRNPRRRRRPRPQSGGST